MIHRTLSSKAAPVIKLFFVEGLLIYLAPHWGVELPGIGVPAHNNLEAFLIFRCYDASKGFAEDD